MSTNDRLNVFPSQMELTIIEGQLEGARRGYRLLKNKSDAIKNHLIGILKKIYFTKINMITLLMKAKDKHGDARFSAGKFNSQIFANVKQASFKISTSVINVAGAKLPVFESHEKLYDNAIGNISLSKGGKTIDECKVLYTKVSKCLVELAGLQTSLKTLDETLKITNRRVNALDCVIIPRFINTVQYIKQELQEREREDNYRLKKIRANKMEQLEKEEEEEKKQLELDIKMGIKDKTGQFIRKSNNNNDDNNNGVQQREEQGGLDLLGPKDEQDDDDLLDEF